MFGLKMLDYINFSFLILQQLRTFNRIRIPIIHYPCQYTSFGLQFSPDISNNNNVDMLEPQNVETDNYYLEYTPGKRYVIYYLRNLSLFNI
jgi:hypothetical protein